jgi:hypothetical protein
MPGCTVHGSTHRRGAAGSVIQRGRSPKADLFCRSPLAGDAFAFFCTRSEERSFSCEGRVTCSYLPERKSPRCLFFCGSDFSRDALAVDGDLKRRAFTLLRRASHFLSLAREKVTKERGTPLTRFAGIRARKVRGRVTGFVDRASCPDAKLAGIHAGHPAGFSSTHPPLQRGPS